MKGLLLKDFYMIKKCCRSYLLLMVVFIAVFCFATDNLFFLFYPCLLAGMIPVTLISYEERDKWHLYSGSLPYSKAQIVSSKYLTGLLLEAGVVVAVAAASLLRVVRQSRFSLEEYLPVFIMIFVVMCISPAICLPCVFKFGAEKGRLAYYLVVGVCAGVMMAGSVIGKRFTFQLTQSWLLVLISVVSVAVYVLSWYLSILFYKRREL